MERRRIITCSLFLLAWYVNKPFLWLDTAIDDLRERFDLSGWIWIDHSRKQSKNIHHEWFIRRKATWGVGMGGWAWIYWQGKILLGLSAIKNLGKYISD
jgi:hypothetical protein